MASVYPSNKNGKVVSYKFKTCVGRDEQKKQVIRCTTWIPPQDLTPAKMQRAAERVAEDWEEEVRTEYQKEQEAKQVNAAWREHTRIVRGNPVRIYEGEKFIQKKW